MITYLIDVDDVHAHLFRVTLTVPQPAAGQRLSLPVWIPGSYLVREFARHVSSVSATQGGQTRPLEQLDKATWLVGCTTADAPLVVTYRVYAFDTSVRAAFLDADRGFFNGTGVFLRVEGREDEAQRVQMEALPDGWLVATALPALEVDGRGRGSYQAASYDELVDHPVELGRFWRGRFAAGGVPHEYVVAGALPDFDGDRLLADARRICEAQIAFWHGAGEKPPFDRYVFLHNLVEEGHGGLEHRASTALISPRRDMPSLAQAGGSERPGGKGGDAPDGYIGLLGLVSHEYFHTWNVKRLRPAEFDRYDYTRENYTGLLWFFEGFTSYYDDLFLVRTGLIDASRYLRLVGRTLSGVLAAPGRQVQSVAASSFDAWVKYYRSDENTPNSTISYYAKGSLVALGLDLTLRAEGKGTLDDVMRALWAASGGGGPIDEAAIAAALQGVGGRSYANELATWVHGTDDLPLASLLEPFGVDCKAEAPTIAQRLGMRVAESALTGVKVSHVLRGGAAERAGISAGDELLAVDGWRVRRLEDAARLLVPGIAAPVWVARDQRLTAVSLTLPPAVGTGTGTGTSTSTGAGPVVGGVALSPVTSPTPSQQGLQKAWLGG